MDSPELFVITKFDCDLIFKMLMFLFSGMTTGQYNNRSNMASERPKNCFWRALSKKYILLCCMCGGLTLTIGVLYLVRPGSNSSINDVTLFVFKGWVLQ